LKQVRQVVAWHVFQFGEARLQVFEDRKQVLAVLMVLSPQYIPGRCEFGLHRCFLLAKGGDLLSCCLEAGHVASYLVQDWF
jgi:hypothetical protein